MGECPWWYTLIKAAKYLGVPPWVLAEQPVAWQRYAEAAMGAEAHAKDMHNRRGKGG